MAIEISSGIVIHDGKILLMDRINKRREKYYTLPGGHVDEGETPTEAVVREFLEETCVKIEVIKDIYQIEWDNGFINHYFLATYLSGEPKLAENSEEKREVDAGIQYYNPLWVPIEQLTTITLYPLEVRDMIIRDYKNNFQTTSKESLLLNFAERNKQANHA